MLIRNTVEEGEKQPRLVWLSGLRARLLIKGSLVQFLVRAHAWISGQVPSRGHVRGNHTLMLFSLSSLFSENEWNQRRRRRSSSRSRRKKKKPQMQPLSAPGWEKRLCPGQRCSEAALPFPPTSLNWLPLSHCLPPGVSGSTNKILCVDMFSILWSPIKPRDGGLLFRLFL